MHDIVNSQFDWRASKISVVDFWAEWCGPCKHQGPIFERLAEEFSSAGFYKANVDKNRDLARHHGITGIPTIIIFNDGKEINRVNGFQTEAKLRDLVLQAVTQNNTP
jgi:thioredoxin 1